MIEMDVSRCLCVIILSTIVNGIDFTFSRQNVLIGSDRKLIITCGITEKDVSSVYLLQIRRLRDTTFSGTYPYDWTTLALIEPGKLDKPSLHPDILTSEKDYVAGGSWDSNSPGNAVLTLSMSIQKLVCADARYYRCELSYKSSTTHAVTYVEKNDTFTAYVKPQVKSLEVRGLIGQGIPPDVPATVYVGDELKLTCNANIGSKPETRIRWHKTSETASTNDFIGYQPTQGSYDDGTATSDNQCGYIRVATIRYNATAADANRENNLAFECYVTVSGGPYGISYTSENNPKFFADVIGFGVVNEGANIVSAGGSGTAAIVGGIVGGLALILIIVLSVNFVFYRRRRIGEKSLKKKVQHQPSECQERCLGDSATTPDMYEQLQNRTAMENAMTYESLRVGFGVVNEGANIVSAGGSGTAAIVGGIVGGLALILIIVLSVNFVFYRRRRIGEKSLKKKVQHQPSECQERCLGDSATTPDMYEQLQNRTAMENAMTYESLRVGFGVVNEGANIVSAGGSGTAAIVGGIVGGLALILIIVLSVNFVFYRRRRIGEKSLKKKVQHQPSECQERCLGDSATTPDMYEQLQNRTAMENAMTYESLRVPENQVQYQPRGSQERGLSDSQTTQGSYEQLQTVMENTYESLKVPENQVQYQPRGSLERGLSDAETTRGSYEQLQTVMENTYESLKASSSDEQIRHYENLQQGLRKF